MNCNLYPSQRSEQVKYVQKLEKMFNILYTFKSDSVTVNCLELVSKWQCVVELRIRYKGVSLRVRYKGFRLTWVIIITARPPILWLNVCTHILFRIFSLILVLDHICCILGDQRWRSDRKHSCPLVHSWWQRWWLCIRLWPGGDKWRTIRDNYNSSSASRFNSRIRWDISSSSEQCLPGEDPWHFLSLGYKGVVPSMARRKIEPMKESSISL